MKKHHILFLTVNAALAVISAVFLCICLNFAGRLESQDAAERWAGSGEMSFAQMSCFMTESDTLSLEDIYTFRQTLAEKLTEASISVPENGSLYIDAWSAGGTVDVSSDHGSSKASVTAVGGDYFFFHQLRLLSGSYITEGDVMDDRVVLDRDLAWRLFGGTDLEGMTVTIDSKPYVIAGVVEREQDFASEKAYSGGAGMYMSYSAYSAITESPIDCYEIVLPQPVDGFAEELMKNNFKLGSGEMINNTGRFSLESIYGIIKDFGQRSMHTTSVIYPYWENAARYMGDWCALMLALAIAFAVIPAISILVTLMIALIHLKDYLGRKVPEIASDAVDRARKKRYVRKGAHVRSRTKRKKAGSEENN